MESESSTKEAHWKLPEFEHDKVTHFIYTGNFQDCHSKQTGLIFWWALCSQKPEQSISFSLVRKYNSSWVLTVAALRVRTSSSTLFLSEDRHFTFETSGPSGKIWYSALSCGRSDQEAQVCGKS